MKQLPAVYRRRGTFLRELTPTETTLADLQGNNDRCFGTVTSDGSADEVRAQFDREFADDLWEKAPNDPYGRAAVRDGLRIDVESQADEAFLIQVRPE